MSRWQSSCSCWRLLKPLGSCSLLTSEWIEGKNRDQRSLGIRGCGGGGLVTPDTFLVEIADLVVAERKIADKQVMTVRSDQGTKEQPVPDALRLLQY